MKIALIGDIHANLPALQAVISHMHTQNIDEIINVGDFVGYGPNPDEVVSVIRELDAINIKGNYDIKVLRFPEKAKKWKNNKRKEKYIAFQWAYENLSLENRNYLDDLPKEIFTVIENWRVLITHGSPESNEEHLTTETPKERLEKLIKKSKADIILCGHSHQPFARTVKQGWFINPGSVGRPDDGDPRASYAILELTPGVLEVNHFRITYDLSKTIENIHKAHLPEAFAQMVIQGYDLDTVLSGHAEG